MLYAVSGIPISRSQDFLTMSDPCAYVHSQNNRNWSTQCFHAAREVELHDYILGTDVQLVRRR
jgi:hypothetical protein